MDLEPRAGSSQVSLWNLPEELVLCILKGLHIKDVLNMRAVNSIFRDLIDDCSAVWKAASFQDTWPSSNNIHYFEKAAKFGNMEALIKMAIAYLYNEGLPGDLEGRKVTSNGIKAAELFCQIEAMNPSEPFTSMFFRPPWSSNEACVNKECVFTYMKDYLQKNNQQDTKNVNLCVANTELILGDKDAACVFLRNACQLGSGTAAFALWFHQSYGSELEIIQQLREIAKMNHYGSKFLLCQYYASGKYGGITPKQAAMYVQELVQSTTPANTQDCLKTSPELTNYMRYILVDWLVEIVVEKNYCSETLYDTVSVVDRYLKCHKTTWKKLELVGVSAMVLCSSYHEKYFFTIRDAASRLTYTTYEDVVRMLGEITATLKGNILVPNSLMFVGIFSSVAELDKKCSCLAEYLCEMTLLHVEMGQYSPAKIGASSVFLARLLMELVLTTGNPVYFDRLQAHGRCDRSVEDAYSSMAPDPAFAFVGDMLWPEKMVEFSGFTTEDIMRCAFHIHEKYVLDGSVVDPRGRSPRRDITGRPTAA